MGRLKIRKKSTDKKLIWSKVRHYIDFIIWVCCLVVIFNIHPVNENISEEGTVEKQKMIYIFHDYEWNQYIMNDTIHWSADSWDYLFADDVPADIKWEEKKTTNSVSLSGLNVEWNSEATDTWEVIENQAPVKDNQVSLKDMMADLWVSDSSSQQNNNNDTPKNSDNNQVVIEVQDSTPDPDEPYYIVTEQSWNNNDSKLVIEKMENSEETSLLSAKIFTFTSDGWVVPILVSRDELNLKWSGGPIAYIDNSWSTYWRNSGTNWNWKNGTSQWSGVTIIPEYADCRTPWGYKIDHWDSVLAYQQMDNAPNICNIERRFCRNGKLSWTYTQQWCSVNENYTYEKWGEAVVNNDDTDSNNNNWKNPDVRQNSDGSVTVNKPLWTGSFAFDRPNKTSTTTLEYHGDNIKIDEEVDQTKRPHRDCTAPWWEKVKHGQFVQAFKHANWFSDAPCEMQIRLCSMWDLMWAYTQSTCKMRDASFIDWVNWYPNWDKSSKEKIEWIKKQIKNEQTDYENARKNAKRSTNSDELDRLLYILDGN